jgi:hypothetical protein
MHPLAKRWQHRSMTLRQPMHGGFMGQSIGKRVVFLHAKVGRFDELLSYLRAAKCKAPQSEAVPADS